MPAPRVFISHASEDKQFVLDFATKLRNQGIDAWVDKWEILPGDSLIDKLFEEGLRHADAVVIVLSNSSVAKPWVREELNATMVKRIEQQTKIIPVLIEECEVPAALKSTVWEWIKDRENYGAELGRIVAAIYGHREKPALGKAPAYVAAEIYPIPGLTRTDNLVLKFACELAIESGSTFQTPEAITAKTSELQISNEEVLDSLVILGQRNCLEVRSAMGGIGYFTVLWGGLDTYLRIYFSDYKSVVNGVAFQILNEQRTGNEEIAKALGRPLVIVDHILGTFANQGWIRMTGPAIGGYRHIIEVLPGLKRAFSQ
jgi:hypothetical protein